MVYKHGLHLGRLIHFFCRFYVQVHCSCPLHTQLFSATFGPEQALTYVVYYGASLNGQVCVFTIVPRGLGRWGTGCIGALSLTECTSNDYGSYC